jgi:hypothetical protein
MSSKTLHMMLWIYIAIMFLFALYEQPWNTGAWTDSDGKNNTGLAWIYTIFWPYAIFKQGSK